jgi:hypothetical protein
MKIRPVGAELFHADARTDRQTDSHVEANSPFSQFCERTKESTRKTEEKLDGRYKEGHERKKPK